MDSSQPAPEHADDAAHSVDGIRRNRRGLATRERILTVAIDFVRGLPSWDWGALTFRVVAERAGMSERTVYRHFASERELHAAVRGRLAEDVGLRYDDITLDEFAEGERRVFAMQSTFSATSWVLGAPPKWARHDERMHGIRAAVERAAPGSSEKEAELAAAMVEAIWSVPTYERLIRWSGLDPADAERAISWAHANLSTAITEGRLPAPAVKKRTRRPR